MTIQITTPEWVHNAVFYQIFPDRFSRSSRTRHPAGVTFKPWGTPPDEQGFQGGDLNGITDRLDYIQQLGVTALYLNPIFSSASNHRYHAFDYMEVDPLLGGNAAFREMLDECHRRGVRVVLDGVFNHASRGFWPFHHILENGLNSPYADWFHVHGLPLRPYLEPGENKPINYAAWWGNAALPKFNTNNPGARQYLYDVARYWIDFGIDGWRLDVPADIDDDEFWREFRRIVKGANPEAYIVGEIWHPARRWLQGDQFDAVMNYPFGKAAMPFFGGKSFRVFDHNEFKYLLAIDAPTFANRIDEFLGFYDWQINLAQMSMLDSHDTPRALWMMGEDKSALRLAALFQMTMPGTPVVYYGDEIGLTGATDPHSRGAFPWDHRALWDEDLLTFYRKAINLRNTHAVLRTGRYARLYAAGEQVAFVRQLGGSEAIVAFNASLMPAKITIPTGNLSSLAFRRVWPDSGGETITIPAGGLSLEIPARSAIVLVNQS